MKKVSEEAKVKNNKSSSKKNDGVNLDSKKKSQSNVSNSKKCSAFNKKISRIKNFCCGNSNKSINKKNMVDKKGNVKNAKSRVKKSNKSKNNKKSIFIRKFSFDIFDLLLIVVITAIVSCLGTGFLLNVQFRKNFSFLTSDVMSNEKIQLFLSTYEEVIDNFYEEVDEDAMLEAALDGMLNFLEDKYSIFLDSDETENLSEMLDGAYEGIGIVAIGNVVYSVYEGSPADIAGIQQNDEIVEINGNSINSENFALISELIEKDTTNSVVVSRNGEKKSFNIEVSRVSVPTVSSSVIASKDKTKKIGYISVSNFSSHTFEEFQEELLDLENNDKISSLIIDLRNNGGGYLNSATNISSLFLDKGDIIYSLDNKDGVTEYKDETSESRDYEIVVLVNANTASAAEVLAAALHDSHGAVIVGNVTYGKGKVQTVKYYGDTMIKYTSAEWLRPNGECVDQKGIEPDYDIELKYEKNYIYDLQLDKAIELLS